MVREPITIQMGMCISVFGKMIKKKEVGQWITKMVVFTQGVGLMIKERDLGNY